MILLRRNILGNWIWWKKLQPPWFQERYKIDRTWAVLILYNLYQVTIGKNSMPQTPETSWLPCFFLMCEKLLQHSLSLPDGFYTKRKQEINAVLWCSRKRRETNTQDIIDSADKATVLFSFVKKGRQIRCRSLLVVSIEKSFKKLNRTVLYICYVTT